MNGSDGKCDICGGTGWVLRFHLDAIFGCIDSYEEFCEKCPTAVVKSLPDYWAVELDSVAA